MSLFPDEDTENEILATIDKLQTPKEKLVFALEKLQAEDKRDIGGFWYNGCGIATLQKLLQVAKELPE